MRLLLDGFKPLGVNGDFFNHVGSYAQPALLEKIAQAWAIYQVNGRGSVPCRLVGRLSGEAARGYEQALVGAPLHRATKVADFFRTHAAHPFFARKLDLKRNKVHSQNADTVYPTVARLATNLDLGETRFAQQALCQSLKSVG